MRKVIFENNIYYHIYNRGVDKRKVFLDKNYYWRFLEYLRELNQEESIISIYRLNQLKRKASTEIVETKFLRSADRRNLVSIICYNLLPNHYHLLLKQEIDRGLARFMHKLNLSYTKYFNFKNGRTGSLFQGTYQAAEVKSDADLLYVSAYINGNAEIHKIAQADAWPWSSCPDYLGLRNGRLCQKQAILSEFKSAADYKKYLYEVIAESSARKEERKKAILGAIVDA